MISGRGSGTAKCHGFGLLPAGISRHVVGDDRNASPAGSQHGPRLSDDSLLVSCTCPFERSAAPQRRLEPALSGYLTSNLILVIIESRCERRSMSRMMFWMPLGLWPLPAEFQWERLCRNSRGGASQPARRWAPATVFRCFRYPPERRVSARMRSRRPPVGRISRPRGNSWSRDGSRVRLPA